MNSLNPQQKMLAEQFLKNPNREQALQILMQQYNITPQQVEQFKNQYNGINL